VPQSQILTLTSHNRASFNSTFSSKRYAPQSPCAWRSSLTIIADILPKVKRLHAAPARFPIGRHLNTPSLYPVEADQVWNLRLSSQQPIAQWNDRCAASFCRQSGLSTARYINTACTNTPSIYTVPEVSRWSLPQSDAQCTALQLSKHAVLRLCASPSRASVEIQP
jgi:hypothetical protein